MTQPEPFFERLSTLDQAFLSNESEACPMHVGAILLLSAAPLRTDAGGVDFGRILTFVEGAVAGEPRFTQRLHDAKTLGEHVWVDDPHFRLEFHVRHTALPAPGDERQLKRLAGRIFSQNLDRRRPLWEFWVVEGLEGDGFALICKVHHCLTDGMGAVKILGSMVGAEPRPAVPFVPRPIPTRWEISRDIASDRLGRLGDVKKGIESLRAKGSDAARRSPLSGVVGTVQKGVVPAPATSLNPSQVGPHRRFDTLRLPLADVKEVKARLGGKLNDVVLTTVALGLHRYFDARGESPRDFAGFRALVPASVRGKDGDALGNRVATLIAEIPVHEPDPIRAYRTVCGETEFLKGESNAIAGMQVLEELDDAMGLGVVSAAFSLAAKLRSFNAIVTNVPGPPMPLPLFGAPMEQVYALVPLFAQQALGIALFSYAGTLHWGFNADWDHVTDLHEFVASVERAFETLLAAARAESGDGAGSAAGG